MIGMDGDDAEHIGVLGLIETARRLNPERGTQFSTYATRWVRQACQRYGPDAALFIRLPARMMESCFSLHRRIERLASEYGSGRAKDELARLCEEDPQIFRRWLALERVLHVRSLSDRDKPEYYEARPLLEAVEGEPIQQVMNRQRGERIQTAMSCLNERERRYLQLRFGMDGDPRSLEEVGQQEGIKRERLR
jgi:RNA polymerase primary sigma factor